MSGQTCRLQPHDADEGGRPTTRAGRDNEKPFKHLGGARRASGVASSPPRRCEAIRAAPGEIATFFKANNYFN
jgi:hypothetical protein